MASEEMSSAAMSGNTNDEDSAVSMLEVLEEQAELEADAEAVLGDSDATNCTYMLGCVPRQALYACMTCNTKDLAGVCLACSYECHDGHELIELYTKRNFRCDCGNSKFLDLSCKLYKDKSKYNTENKYNHNFRGLYCICDRPYPDPDDDIEDEMIQCIICEDWYHGRHLGFKEIPESFNGSEMVCKDCMAKNDFLWAYVVDSLDTQKVELDDTDKNVNVTCKTPEKRKLDNAGTSKGKNSPSKKMKLDQTADRQTVENSCFLKELQKRKIAHKNTAAFFSDGWRSKLCNCKDCINLYCELDIGFLTDESDTVHAYEVRGKEKASSSQYDKGLAALSNMNRLQQVEVLHGYNDLKSELADYLKKFAEDKKVVTEKDIREFFGQLEAKKRNKKSSGEGMSYFCK